MTKNTTHLILIVSFLLVPFSSARAAEFNPNNIISDYELEDVDSLSQEAIQRFLEQKGSFLAQFTEVVNGVRKPAAKIIYEEAQLYDINPKFILAMLQKEQSLITDASPSQKQLDWATGFGVCDSCSKSDPRLAPLKGFYNQVSGLAEKVRKNYLRDLIAIGKTFTGWGPGTSKTTLDGYSVTPANKATSILYTYNPYRGGDRIGANYNFWKIWQRYFVRNHPDGSLLQMSGDPVVWLLQNGTRRAFKTRTALYSRYDPSRIIQVSQNELEKHPVGPPILYPNYSLLRAPSGTVYLLVDDVIRGITSEEVFRTIGFNPEELIWVEEEDIALYTVGDPITLASAYPTGGLLQDNKTGAVFFVQDGERYAITDRTIMAVNFPRQRPTPLHPETLAQYPYTGRMKLEDGTIITSPGFPAVYVIADGKKRAVVSGEVFEKLGYRWEDIIEVPQHVVALHEAGSPLDLIEVSGTEEVLGDNVLEENE